MAIINTLRFSEHNGMQICTIGNRQYRVASNNNAIILFPIVSVQDEFLKQRAKTRLERSLSRRKNPDELRSTYPFWASFEKQSLNTNPQTTT